ncbi:hypothetical protein FB567DRAFT_506336 [Paraphoma chrysanthemicola]|uniref:Uncharacterized protein n=1 Tax=Paraphoma chrysanthemicola TaxID=798071 RepID=A0A8K0QWS0_9PLEO|nr:hypothetical protein FB567DRAFT_506336 [Paraphoma chrysanthemicola]
MPPFSEQFALSEKATQAGSISSSSTIAPTDPTILNEEVDIYESLPTISCPLIRSVDLAITEDTLPSFLRRDLDLSRLNRIHNHLWMAGRPMRARPLHKYRLMDYQYLGIEQMDLHLLSVRSSPNQLLLKPLPEWILSHKFWTKHLCSASEPDLHASACGLILSYVWLITTPLDLKLGHEFSLIPHSMTWPWWKLFVKDILSTVDASSLHQVNRRYHFGDLRMDRINLIYRYRYFATHFVRGYWYPPPRYIPFFERNFSWVLIPFVFFSLILSAMQVGVSLDRLNNNATFIRASYGMVMFSMTVPLALLSTVVFGPLLIFSYNVVAGTRQAKYAKETRGERRDRILAERVTRAV